MIRLFPKVDLAFACPICHTTVAIEEIIIPGMRPLAKTTCTRCARSFFQDLPVSHALHYPTSIDVATGELFFTGLDWYPLLLQGAFHSQKNERMYPMSIYGEQNHRRIIILNCLDTYYGHSLLKLLNAQYYLDHYPDYDILIILPACLAWMTPSGPVRSLIVDIPLKESFHWMKALDEKLKRMIFPAYEEILLSSAYSHPHPSQVNLKRFIPNVDRIPTESLLEINSSDQPVRVTYITREDRLWITSEHLSRFFMKYGSKSIIRALKSLIVLYQNKKIERVYQLLKRRFPQVIFTVAGLASIGTFSKGIIDERKTKLTPEEEERWCRLYAQSHLIIGIHGSNMLLPSAFAGMTLNLLPYFKFSNFLQDVLVQETDIRLAIYRYRHLPIDTSIRTIAKTAISQLTNFKKFYKNNLTYTHVPETMERM